MTRRLLSERLSITTAGTPAAFLSILEPMQHPRRKNCTCVCLCVAETAKEIKPIVSREEHFTYIEK